MNSRFARFILLLLALGFLTGAGFLWPIALELYSQAQVETAASQEVIGLIFVMPFAPFVLALCAGLAFLFFSFKGLRLGVKR